MKKIFVVDDNSANLLMADDVLSDYYDVITFLSAPTMFNLLDKIIPDLILLDIMMPEMDGFAALTLLKENRKYADIPVMFLTSKNDAETEARGFEMGVMDFITKPFSGPVLLNRIKKHLMLESIIADRTSKLQQRTEKLLRLQSNMASVLANMVESRDKLTGKHIERTAAYLEILIKTMLEKGLYKDELLKWDLDLITSSARLHDLGKIVVSDLLLNKPGKLTTDEFEIIKTHSSEGENIIEDIIDGSDDEEFLVYAKVCAGSHHEKWDGSGYPRGLKGDDIPLLGRIMAIADVYDALVSERTYKEAFSHEKSVGIILENKGLHFEPEIVDIFLEVEPLFEKVAVM